LLCINSPSSEGEIFKLLDESSPGIKQGAATMATRRYLSTSFWDDQWIQNLSPQGKLLYLYLLTNPLTNISGVYKISLKRICFDIGFDMNTVKQYLQLFENEQKAFCIGEYIAIPAWPKHQSWKEKVRIRDGILSELQELPEDVLASLEVIGYQFDLSLVESEVIPSKLRVGVSGTTSKQLMEKFQNRCAHCGKEGKLIVHRIKALQEGGDNSFENLSLLCPDCYHSLNKSHAVHIDYEDSDGLDKQSTSVSLYSHSLSDSHSQLDLDCDESPEIAHVVNEQDLFVKKRRRQPFQKPTLEEVKEYCKEKNYSFVPEDFFDFYESNDWTVKGSPMKNWKHSAVVWQSNMRKFGNKQEKAIPHDSPRFTDFTTI
jgi:5-methylcytosine-specific restriction endonuclease McrA